MFAFIRDKVRRSLLYTTETMADSSSSSKGKTQPETAPSNAVKGDSSNEQVPDVLPVTKVPALDTIDPYVVNRATVVARSPAIELAGAFFDPRNVAKEIVQGYARFVAQITGLEDVAFAIYRDAAFVTQSEVQRAVVCASVFAPAEGSKGETCTLHEVDHARYNPEEIQFALQLRGHAASENGEQHAAPDDVSQWNGNLVWKGGRS